MAPEHRGHDRALLVLLAVVIALVAVAVAVVLTRSEPELRAAGTPEGVVQRYAAAVLSGDLLAAEQYLSAEALESCDGRTALGTDDVRVTLVSTDARGSAATVRVRITVSYGDPPFGLDESASDEVFQLVEEDDGWRIDTVPWQLETCLSRGVP